MTSIDVETGAACSSAQNPAEERRKSVLFCPVCGHESPPDGDWFLTLADDGTEFVCPHCDRVVATR